MRGTVVVGVLGSSTAHAVSVAPPTCCSPTVCVHRSEGQPEMERSSCLRSAGPQQKSSEVEFPMVVVSGFAQQCVTPAFELRIFAESCTGRAFVPLRTGSRTGTADDSLFRRFPPARPLGPLVFAQPEPRSGAGTRQIRVSKDCEAAGNRQSPASFPKLTFPPEVRVLSGCARGQWFRLRLARLARRVGLLGPCDRLFAPELAAAGLSGRHDVQRVHAFVAER